MRKHSDGGGEGEGNALLTSARKTIFFLGNCNYLETTSKQQCFSDSVSLCLFLPLPPSLPCPFFLSHQSSRGQGNHRAIGGQVLTLTLAPSAELMNFFPHVGLYQGTAFGFHVFIRH